ncbi:DMT family transporter [Cognatishimia maritima]|uniref:S-adenosylmethionine uptake transporter n=1 Tax=Cognatishimia maritima TaxID=870908 RepID=A0A1M5MST4_9RHOB|nr:DMT family transporter [Cognatishimia maritima]SHG80321.1 S-adenosylmethionine uptake transporter [Cognatishimia maritima]
MISDNLRGAFLMMGSMAFFTFNDACIKAIGSDMPLSQLLVLRGALTSIMIALLAWKLGVLRFDIARRDWGLLFLRTAGEVGAAYYFIEALRKMEIANVTAVLQALPLTVALGAALLFKEPLGWRRLLAIFIGFIGILLILRPGPSGFTPESISVLIAVAFVTLRDLSTRKISKRVPSLMGAFTAAIGVTAFAALMSLNIEWTPVSGHEAGLIVASSFLIGGAYLCSVMTMRVGEIAFIAPFRYTSLVWALIVGLLIFGEWPDGLTLIGAGIVVATGLFTLYRETRAKARQAKLRRI